MNKKAPIYRLCVVTRELLPITDLFRICKTKSGEIVVDETHKNEGRGAYIKKDLKTITIAHDRKLLSRALRHEVKDDIYLKLISMLGKERRG